MFLHITNKHFWVELSWVKQQFTHLNLPILWILACMQMHWTQKLPITKSDSSIWDMIKDQSIWKMNMVIKAFWSQTCMHILLFFSILWSFMWHYPDNAEQIGPIMMYYVCWYCGGMNQMTSLPIRRDLLGSLNWSGGSSKYHRPRPPTRKWPRTFSQRS